MSTLADRIRGVLQGTSGPIRPGAATLLRPRDPVAADSQPEAGHQPLPIVSGSSRAERVNSLESVLGGRWRQCGDALCFVVESRRERSSRHGSTTVGALGDALREAAENVPLLAGFPLEAPFCFFDLETTGLSGGAGTYAFLVGCAAFDEDGGFVSRQFMLVRLADERALLTSLADELSRAGALVSFNGKSFDAPLVETRCFYHRLAWTGSALPHLDMLHVARRLWKRADEVAGGAPLPAAWESGCSLGALERQLLGHRRHGDVSGFEIPQRYFQFVRTGDPRPLVPVFEHNRLDLLSLAALTARAAQLARTGPAGARDSREALALGWIYARAGLEPRARHAYERAVELSARLPAIHVESLHMLAMLLRRARQYDEAAKHWRRILEVRDCPRHVAREASDALAIHHEHRLRDLVSAREFALGSLERTGRPARDEAVRHRLNRIDRKLERLKSDPSRLQFAEPSSLT